MPKASETKAKELEELKKKDELYNKRTTLSPIK
jgi:hypothetical protein